ncbi:hypothetical protein AQS8620_00973 [Aquimixticola soesokkakensis]|uniref:Sulfotransferase domain protein n=1 Tax=Aquimixticola soesokkakensis TaxID=1519096 RepID=A0A1Y5S1Y1_9RHOB|nr:sulfotransferase [Aquimixticola soesokkakensis]SLN30726.1 hypothetical protein AQS8620_00973 [Aquimixticola soesokkakensis]
MARKPTVLICVGATKAGTSWLYDYLEGHPQVWMRTVKEVHYFDAIDLKAGWVANGLKGQIKADAAKLATLEAGTEWHNWLTRRIADATQILALIEAGTVDEAAYLAYLYDGVEARAKVIGQEVRVVGDITPAYALLSEERLKAMAGMAEDVRVVFLMRDPLDRLWSHVRMNASRQAKADEDVVQKSRRMLNQIVRKGAEADILTRGDYPAIVAKLKRAVPQAKLMLAFNEQLITPEGVTELCDFLGLDPMPADTDKRVHEGVKIKMNERQKREAQEFLAPHYAYVEETLGMLPQRWHANMVRV